MSAEKDTASQTWYILKQADGHCQITSTAAEPDSPQSADQGWGPFSSEAEAIARRVGLIRAGKCLPN